MIERSEFVRQSPRAVVRTGVMVSCPEGALAVGHVVDISATGISVRVGRRLRTGDVVSIVVDTAGILISHDGTAPTFADRLPALNGSVSWTTRDGELDGRPMFRAGILFTSVPDRVTRQLRELPARLSPPPEAQYDETSLAQSATGRERLFQLALERLDRGDHAGARAAARSSLAVIPHARHMRALLCRIEAEAALAEDAIEEARRRIGHGRRLAPDDPSWVVLEQRARGGERGGRRGFWSKLFG